MRVRWFVRDACRALARTAVPSLAAMLTIIVTAVVLAMFVPLVQAVGKPEEEKRGRVVFDVYLRAGVSAIEREKARQALVVTPNVKRVEFVTKEEVRDELLNYRPEAFPQPTRTSGLDLFRVTPADPAHIKAVEDRLVGRDARGRRVSRPAAIEGVRRHQEHSRDVVSFSRLLVLLAVALGTPMVLACVAVVANAVRLSIFVRRREVELMRLVGATSWFIRWPFVIEGLLVGLAGGALAVAVLAVGQKALIAGVFGVVALLPAPRSLDLGTFAAVLTPACVAGAAVGSALTVRRFVHV